MALSPMRYKNYIWPHNPRVYEIEYKKQIVRHKIPFGKYVLQNHGRLNRVLRGEGEFAGKYAYDEFKKLATVFYSDEPGILAHPVWQTSNAYFTSLILRQEPRPDYVSYSFEFWESYDGYDSQAQIVYQPETVQDETWYTVVYGDTLWGISIRNGMTLNQLLAINPQVKNPNILYPGDRIRVK